MDLLPAKVDRFMAASLHGTGDIRQYETLWDGTPIENDHDHKNTFCTFFFKGEFHLVAT